MKKLLVVLLCISAIALTSLGLSACKTGARAKTSDQDSQTNSASANITYTITWMNGETTLKTEKVAEGETPEYTGEAPVKDGDEQYSYTFKGWEPAIVAATADATYTATFERTVNKYAITWMNGETTLGTDEVEFGETPEYTGATPTKEDDEDYFYVFAGWNETILPVLEDATYTAAFRAVEHGVVKEFNNNVTDINLPEEHGSAEYTTDYHYGDEAGSLKLTTAKGGEVYLGIGTPLTKDISAYDYLSFYVYNPTESDIMVGTFWACDTNCAAGEWTEVKVTAANFASGRVVGWSNEVVGMTDVTPFVIRFISGFKTGDEFYISAVRACLSQEKINNVVKAFDREVKNINLPEEHGTASYTTDYHYGEEKGSLKLTTAKSGEVYLGIGTPVNADISAYDYLSFYVYNPTESAIMVGTFWACDTTCAAGEWTEVKVTAANFASGNVVGWSNEVVTMTDVTPFVIRFISGFKAGDVFYVSAVLAKNNELPKNIVKAFGYEVNDINLPAEHGTAAYSTDYHYGEEKGSLKLTAAKGSEVYLCINSGLINDITAYDYLSFYVYNATEANVGVGTLWAADTTCAPGVWTQVKVARSLFDNDNIDGWSTKIHANNITGFIIRFISGFKAGDVFYISSITAEMEESNVVKSFGTEVKDINIPAEHGTAEYTTDYHHGDDKGSMKVTMAKGSEVYLALDKTEITDITKYDYISFYVYNPTETDIKVGTLWAADTVCKAGEWTQVKVARSLFDNDNIDGWSTKIHANNIAGFIIRFIDGFKAGDVFYVSTITAEKA